MALDIGTLVAKVKVDDSDFDQKTSGWSAKGAAIGSAFGNVAADAISQATSMLVDFVGEAANASDQTKKFQDTLSFAGLSTANIEALKAATQAYADETVYNLGDIQSITASLASNGVKDYDTLAMALGNLNAVAGGSPETYGRLGSMLTQTAGAGKLTTENWNQLTDAISGASGPIQDALLQAGAYTGNFREAMEAGEITAEEFNAAIMALGTEPIAVEAARSVETFEGSAGNLSAAIQGKLVQALEAVKPAFTGLQNALAWFIGNSGLLVPLISGLGVALLVVLAPALWAAVVATAAWTVALLANPMTWIVLGIVALVAAIVWLIQNWDTAVTFITDIWGGFIGWITGVIEGFVGWWNGVWAAVGEWIKGVWEGFTKWVGDVFRNFQLGLQLVGAAISGWWTGLWAGIGAWIQSVWEGFTGWVRGVATGFVAFIIGAFNGYVSFWRGLWEGVRTTIVSIWEGIVAWFQSIPGAIKAVFNGAASWLWNIGRDILQGLWNGLKSIWSSIAGWFENTVGGIIDTFKGLFGIASPSRVFREFGVFIGQGLIDGLEAMGPAYDATVEDTFGVPDGGVGMVGGAGGNTYVTHNERHVEYVAAPHATFDAQEEFFAAMGSPRVAL
ncbi:tape measure protein [Microbacterium sp. QXD-8]|uniref:Tape measure protein n=1 Tax=Microbacterium psychrotolerans TaxID=3068321 RepID=A0ABU0YYA1_9MICO|nr:tape measure protein [Microbacterium sp. QXD-8]MDQ7877311.1 tape measure protein [Microbacterium sp. QXD-8]